MDSRLESIESLALLEGDFSKLKTDNDTIYSKLCSIETLLQILTRGKSIVDEGKYPPNSTLPVTLIIHPLSPHPLSFLFLLLPFLQELLKYLDSMALIRLVGLPELNNILS